LDGDGYIIHGYMDGQYSFGSLPLTRGRETDREREKERERERDRERERYIINALANR
jgi:hypothetical protein